MSKWMILKNDITSQMWFFVKKRTTERIMTGFGYINWNKLERQLNKSSFCNLSPLLSVAKANLIKPIKEEELMTKMADTDNADIF